MRQKLVIGNWKMHGNLASNAQLLTAFLQLAPAQTTVKRVVCAPPPYLLQCRKFLAESTWQWGAQDVSSHAVGAYTGEVSAAMLADVGCTYVLIGHSERRAYHAETDALIAQKVSQALDNGLIPVLCVGETLAQREAEQTNQVVAEQLGAVLQSLTLEQAQKLVVAYEPVWAIGTGRTASAEQAQAVHVHLRRQLVARDASLVDLPILYGGSVKASNAAELFTMPDVDGALVGGAALVAEEFLAICAARC